MIELRTGNLFDADTEVLTNTVNCVGVMGKGIALEFKNRYPAMFELYRSACRKGGVQTGAMWIWNTSTVTNPRYIFNFPTKEHWRNPSKLEWISAGLDDLKIRVIMLGVKSIALPALGCANGGLRFEDVRELIFEKLNDLDASVVLYEPQ